jgi:hypothetical protein
MDPIKRGVALAALGVCVLAATPAPAALYTFSGSSNGGTAAGTIDVSTSGSTLTAYIDNTTDDPNSAYDDAAITGFGFNLTGGLDFTEIISWTLTAYDAASGTTVQVGGTSGTNSTPSWTLSGTDQNVSLDLIGEAQGILGGCSIRTTTWPERP